MYIYNTVISITKTSIRTEVGGIFLLSISQCRPTPNFIFFFKRHGDEQSIVLHSVILGNLRN